MGYKYIISIKIISVILLIIFLNNISVVEFKETQYKYSHIEHCIHGNECKKICNKIKHKK